MPLKFKKYWIIGVVTRWFQNKLNKRFLQELKYYD